MATQKNVDNIILGAGDLYVNDILVGHLDGDVELECTKELLEIKPNGYKNPLKVFIISQESVIRAPVAEFKTSMLKYALGVTNTISESVCASVTTKSYASYDNAQGTARGGNYSIPAGSYEIMTFGGETQTDVYPIRLEVEKPNGEYFIVVFYKVANIGSLALTLSDDNHTITNLELKGLAIEDRDAGDRVGTFFHQVGSA